MGGQHDRSNRVEYRDTHGRLHERVWQKTRTSTGGKRHEQARQAERLVGSFLRKTTKAGLRSKQRMSAICVRLAGLAWASRTHGGVPGFSSHRSWSRLGCTTLVHVLLLELGLSPPMLVVMRLAYWPQAFGALDTTSTWASMRPS